MYIYTYIYIYIHIYIYIYICIYIYMYIYICTHDALRQKMDPESGELQQGRQILKPQDSNAQKARITTTAQVLKYYLRRAFWIPRDVAALRC